MEDSTHLVLKLEKKNIANLMYFLKQFEDAKIVGIMYEANILPNEPVKHGSSNSRNE